MREFLPLALALLAPALPLAAQDEAPPAPKTGVQIAFLPPPMHGTLSLGIYTKAGKLVRILRREAVAQKDFTTGLNGLILQWDGKDDAGKAAPAGPYSVRGYAVGTIEVSGEAFHGNEWISSEDAPHLRSIQRISVLPGDRLGLVATLADGAEAAFDCGVNGDLHAETKGKMEIKEEDAQKADGLGDAQAGHVGIENGKLVIGAKPPASGDLHLPVDFSPGKGGTLWVIDRSPERVEVQQYSPKGEFLRRLSVTAGEPVPEKIAASTEHDLVYLLERAPGVERVRGLALESLQAPLPAADAEPAAGAPKSSTWRIVFSRTIRQSDDFARAAEILGKNPAPKPEAKVPVKLAANPLFQEGSPDVEVTVERESTGSFLYTSDGLPLCRLTDTPGLRWAVLLHEGKTLSLLQSDGAVIEEYRLGKLTNMMAFDAGEYEWKP